MANDNSILFDKLINSLQTLGYDSECWDHHWMIDVFTEQNVSRKKLLKWTLAQLGINNVDTDILNAFVSIGICKPSDAADVDGTSNFNSQIKFWSNLLKYVEYVKKTKVKRPKHYSHDSASSHFLNEWITSSQNTSFSKDERLTLLPAHLLKQYKQAQYVPSSINCSLAIPNSVSEDDNCSFDIKDGIISLTKTSQEMDKIHKVYLSPWCQTNPPIADQEFTEVIQRNEEKTSHFTSMLSQSNNVGLLASQLESEGFHWREKSNKASSVLNSTVKD